MTGVTSLRVNRVLVLALIALALAGCTADPDAAGPPTPPPNPTTAATTAPTPPGARVVLAARQPDGWIGGKCVATSYAASPETPSKMVARDSGSTDWYGGRDLWTALAATTEAAVLPEGGFSVKIGWWRLADSKLQLRAERLDGPGTAIPDVPDGYGSRGFQASGAVLSALGCWRFTGWTETTEVSFVSLIWAPSS
jgi:hypothetical protein